MPEVANMKLGHMRNLVNDIHDALGKADIAYSGLSTNGINVVGDKESIKAVTEAIHRAGTVSWYQAELKDEQERIKALRVINTKLMADMANCPLMLQRMINERGLQHVLLGLECITNENGRILDYDGTGSAKTIKAWGEASVALGKLARETEL